MFDTITDTGAPLLIGRRGKMPERVINPHTQQIFLPERKVYIKKFNLKMALRENF